ncbi:MAG: phytoene desaturase family protein [Silvanigrellaceae bacterium]
MRSSDARHQLFDVAVFGSGLAGLSCARRLAVRGQKVVVVEKAKELGGHLLPFERSGATFEVGLHYIADTRPGSHFSASLEKLGINLEQIPLDNEFETLIFDAPESQHFEAGRSISYQSPLNEFSARLKQDFPEQRQAIEKYFELLELVWEVAKNLKFPVKIRDVLRIAMAQPVKGKLLFLATSTLSDVFDACRMEPRLREILAVHHVLIGVPPSRVSAFLHMTVQRYYFEHAGFVRGGGRAMIAALMHPEVHYRSGVDAMFERVHDASGLGADVRWRLSLPDGECLYAKNLVWTPDPRAMAHASRGVKLSVFMNEKLARAEAPHALVVGYFATRKPLNEYGFGNRNYWLMGSLDSEACYRVQDPQELAQASPLYLSMGSLRDPDAIQQGNKLGAEGVFQAMFLCPPSAEIWGGEDPDQYRLPESKGGYGRQYRVLKERVLKNLTQRIVACWPQLEGELVWMELGSPLTHRRYLNSLTLNGYGYAPTVSDLLWKRPSAWTGEDGLYLCGAHIRPSHGIVTALLNGVGLADLLTSCEH